MTKLSQPTTETLAPKHPSLLPIYPADIVKITSVSSTYQVVIKKTKQKTGGTSVSKDEYFFRGSQTPEEFER